MAFLAIVVAPAIALHVRAGAPQMRAFAYITLYLTLLGRKALGPLGLVLRFAMRLPSLLMSQFGRKWSTYPLGLLWALTFHLVLHLLYHTLAFSTRAAKSLMDNGATIKQISPRRPFSNFLHRHSSSSGMV